MKSAIIPEEMVLEILKRLPVKSICRFRAVSKRWLSILTSRPFTDSHFEISKLNPTRLFEFHNHEVSTFFSTPYPNTKTTLHKCDDPHYWYCSISPRGLICLYGSSSRTVQIWNPSTGERLEVNPKPPHKPSALSAYFLGFDPISKKHKLLSPSDRDYYLLTLGEKKWRKIITTDDDDGSSRDLNFSQQHCSIDGIVYYLARPCDQYEYSSLAAFDFGSESFLETIRLPGKLDIRYESYIDGRIWVYRGRIVLLNYDLHTGGFETWVLEDVEKQKWSPKRIIPLPTSPEPYELGVIDGEELILYSGYVGADGLRLCKYDLEKGSWSETRFPNFRVEEIDGSVDQYKVKLYCYVDSLESLKSRRGILMKKKNEKEEVVSLN